MSLAYDTDEELFTADHGLFLACRPERVNPHGVAQPEHIRVLKPDGRQLGTLLRLGDWSHAIHWRTAKGDVVEPPTLEALVERCAA